MDIKTVIEQFHDYLGPKLDTYEQAIYLYILRHSRLQDKAEATIGFKSARRKMAFGIGEKGKPMSEGTCYEKLRSLESKGCLRILGTVRDGTRVRLTLPSEIPGLIPVKAAVVPLRLEEIDFFTIPENRLLILRRENSKCFYCLRALDGSNYIIEHIISRPEGNNTYRNVVAACCNCNNQKGELSAEDFVRGLYRKGFLKAEELNERLARLNLVQSSGLKPVFESS